MLTGELPTTIGDLANLQGLCLSGNQFSGEIPIQLAKLRDLKYLDLSIQRGITLGPLVLHPLPRSRRCLAHHPAHVPQAHLQAHTKYRKKYFDELIYLKIIDFADDFDFRLESGGPCRVCIYIYRERERERERERGSKVD
ncbi:Non-specific serine/threonine protein kinase [Bertholletia excelsa]